MTSEHAVNPDVRALAELFADRTANQMSLAINELREALAPAKKVRSEAAQRVTLFTLIMETDTAAAPKPAQVLGKGIAEQRSRVTVWCSAGSIVYLAKDRGQLQSAATRVQLVPLVPLVLLDASELFASTPDATPGTVCVIVEEYDAP
jgi:hypothetical protein